VSEHSYTFCPDSLGICCEVLTKDSLKFVTTPTGMLVNAAD
jgi:hypothetical protein